MKEGFLLFLLGFLDRLWLNLPHLHGTPNVVGLCCKSQLNCFTNPYSVCITKEEDTSSQVSKWGVSFLIGAVPPPVLTDVDGTLMMAIKAGFQEKLTQPQRPLIKLCSVRYTQVVHACLKYSIQVAYDRFWSRQQFTDLSQLSEITFSLFWTLASGIS